jgi:hypothetical protein
MMSVLKKMRYKGQSPVLLMNAPAEFKDEAKGFAKTIPAPKGEVPYALAFAKSMADCVAAGKAVGKCLSPDGIFWLAYPKGTSKKYKGTDVNRDTGNAALHKIGFEGVAMVAIDGDWSAMRFKRT